MVSVQIKISLTAIGNLVRQSCIKVPCRVDRSVVTLAVAVNLPLNLTALMMANINVQTPVEEAFGSGKKEHLYHAALKVPHKTAELKLDQDLADD